MRMEVSIAEQQLEADREQINRLMGLSYVQTGWSISPGLPELPSREIRTSELEIVVLRNRLDLQAARAEIASIVQAVSIMRGFRYFADVQFGVEPRLLTASALPGQSSYCRFLFSIRARLASAGRRRGAGGPGPLPGDRG